jgi:hypothetical protein
MGVEMTRAVPQRVFVLTLEPKRGVDPIKALRALLKLALRRFGMRCVAVEEVANEGESHDCCVH